MILKKAHSALGASDCISRVSPKGNRPENISLLAHLVSDVLADVYLLGNLLRPIFLTVTNKPSLLFSKSWSNFDSQSIPVFTN